MLDKSEGLKKLGMKIENAQPSELIIIHFIARVRTIL
jgi:hypothetical protein